MWDDTMSFWDIFKRKKQPVKKVEKIEKVEKVEKKEAFRKLPDEEAIRLDGVPESWREPKIPSIQTDDLPTESGKGYVHSPYSDIYTKKWGVTPIADLSKYREIKRNDPIVQSAIKLQVSMALDKGYHWETNPNHPLSETLIEATEKLFAPVRDEFDNVALPAITENMLTYGTAFMEKIYGYKEVEKTIENKANRKATKYYTDTKGRKRSWNAKKELELEEGTVLMNIKVLDPLHMRVRADSLGNIYGYLQILSSPPVAFAPSKIAQYKWNPTSTPYESAYGTSDLQALIRTEYLMRAVENNLYIAGHAIVKTPVIYKPFQTSATDIYIPSDDEVSRMQAYNSERKSGDDVIALSMDVIPFDLPGKSLQAMLDFYEKLREDRYVALGVPRNILGIPEGSSHTTAAVNQDMFIVKVHGIQGKINEFTMKNVVIPGLVRTGFKEKQIVESGLQMKFDDLAIQDQNMDSNRALAEWKGGGLKLNELRKELKLDELEDDELGEQFSFEIQGAQSDIGGGFGGFGGGDIPEIRDPMRTERASVTPNNDYQQLQNPSLKPRPVETPTPKKEWDPYEKFFDDIVKDWETEEYKCQCIKCGWDTKTKKHCIDIKCEECGGEMRRKNRIGVGK